MQQVPLTPKSPWGIPYNFRFAVRDANQNQAQSRNFVKWVVDRVDSPTPYMCLRSQWTQLILNPGVICCSILIILMSVIYYFMNSLIGASASFLYLSCSASSFYDSSQGAAYQFSDTVFGILNQSCSSALSQFEYSLNATLWNVQTSCGQYISLLGVYYQDLNYGLPKSALDSAKNVTDTLSSWIDSEMSKAENYTAVLYTAIQSASEAFTEAGILSDAQSSNMSTVFDNRPSLDLNDKLVEYSSSDGANNFYNITQNVLENVIETFNNVSVNVTALMGRYSNFLSNISFTDIPSAYTADNCEKTVEYFDDLRSNLSSQYRTQMAIIGSMAGAFCVLAAIYLYYRWKVNIILCKKVEYPEKSVADSLQYFNCSKNLPLAYLHLWGSEKMDKPTVYFVYAQWLSSYLLSGFLVDLLAAGVCLLFLSLCSQNLASIVNAANSQHYDVSFVGNSTSSSYSSSASYNQTSGNITVSMNTEDLNDYINEYEQGINKEVSDMMTELVTNLNSVLTTFNTTLFKSVSDTLESTNLTFPSTVLDFELIFENGYAIGQLSYPRVSSILAESLKASSNPLFGGDHVFGLPELQNSINQCTDIFRVSGGVLLGVWGFFVLMSSAYAGIISTKLSKKPIK